MLDLHLRRGAKPDALLLDLRTADQHQVKTLETLFNDVACGLLKHDPLLCAAAPQFMAGHDGALFSGCPDRYQATLRMLEAAGATLVLDAGPDSYDSNQPLHVTCEPGVAIPFDWWSAAVALAVLQARWAHVTERTAPPGGSPVL